MPKQNTDIKYIIDDISEIKKSIKTLNEHSEQIAKIATDVEWLKQFYWVIMSAVIGGLIIGIFNLIK